MKSTMNRNIRILKTIHHYFKNDDDEEMTKETRVHIFPQKNPPRDSQYTRKGWKGCV